jgi:flavin reductase (DIM6/NTAB) family NADH-FMN oxidoreductase RutF
MTKRKIESLNSAYRLLNPGSVVIISCGDGEKDNLFSVTWNMPVRKEPGMVGILAGKRHFSYGLIEKTGEFGLNIMNAAHVNAVFGCGSVSGYKVSDKFEKFGLTREKSAVIKAPLVAQAVASVECRIVTVHDMGASALLIAQILAGTANEEHFDGENWKFENGLELIHHLGGNKFCTSNKVVEAK